MSKKKIAESIYVMSFNMDTGAYIQFKSYCDKQDKNMAAVLRTLVRKYMDEVLETKNENEQN